MDRRKDGGCYWGRCYYIGLFELVSYFGYIIVYNNNRNASIGPQQPTRRPTQNIQSVHLIRELLINNS